MNKGIYSQEGQKFAYTCLLCFSSNRSPSRWQVLQRHSLSMRRMLERSPIERDLYEKNSGRADLHVPVGAGLRPANQQSCSIQCLYRILRSGLGLGWPVSI